MQSSSTASQQPQPQLRDQTLVSSIVIVAKVWFAGFFDALAFGRAATILMRSKKAYSTILNCFLLNGLLLLGSYFIYEYLVGPGIKNIIPTERGLHFVFSTVYYVCWVYPVYVFSYVVNLAWYNDIAQQAFIFSGHTTEDKVGDSIGKKMSDIVYDLALCGSFMIVTIAISTFLTNVFSLEATADVFKFIQLSWLYAFYCFDCKWSLRGKWGITKRVQVFETYWVYMSGFGTPFTLAFYFFPYLVSNGIFALLYPVFLILAVRAKPQKTDNAKYIPLHLPLFWLADKLNRKFFSFIGLG
jgi:etoposide-induced 2.4 mRNA